MKHLLKENQVKPETLIASEYTQSKQSETIKYLEDKMLFREELATKGVSAAIENKELLLQK